MPRKAMVISAREPKNWPESRTSTPIKALENLTTMDLVEGHEGLYHMLKRLW